MSEHFSPTEDRRLDLLLEPQADAIQRDTMERGAPGFTGIHRHGTRERPRGHNLARCERRIDLLACQQADEMAQRRNGPVENVRGVAGVDHAPIAKKIDRKGGKRFLPFENVRSERMSHPDQQRAMEAIGGDSISGGKLPSGKDRLNNFESMRDPLHARKQGGLVHFRSWRPGKTENDFRLDARLGKSGKRQYCRSAKVMHGGVVDIALNWCVDFVLLPDDAIGEADFPPKPLLATRFTLAIEKRSHDVGILKPQARCPRREGRYLAARVNRCKDFIRDDVKIRFHDGPRLLAPLKVMNCWPTPTIRASVIPGPRALGSALRAVRAQAPRAEPGIHNYGSCRLRRTCDRLHRLGLWIPGSLASPERRPAS